MNPWWGRSFLGCVCNPTTTAWGMRSELEPEPQIQALLLMGNFSSLGFSFLNKAKFKPSRICRTRLFFMLSLLSASPQPLLPSERTEHPGVEKSIWYPTKLNFGISSQKRILAWCIHPYFLKCAGEQGDTKERTQPFTGGKLHLACSWSHLCLGNASAIKSKLT